MFSFFKKITKIFFSVVKFSLKFFIQSFVYLTEAQKMSEDYKFTEEDDKIYNYECEDMIIHKMSREDKETNQQKSVFIELIKQLKPNVEIYRMNIPAFLLHQVSLLEKISTQFTPNSILDK
jgi:uncharacterized protein YwgA